VWEYGSTQFATVEFREFFERNLGSRIETESVGGHIGNRKIHKKDRSPEKIYRFLKFLDFFRPLSETL
jgi:hypothetical protein